MKAAGILVGLLSAAPVVAQTPTDPYPRPIRATEGMIRVDYREFATLPDIDGQAARMMLLLAEPGGQRLFVNDMRGPLYTVTRDGGTVAEYVNTDDPAWGHDVQSSGRERGFQSFALHPQFNERGAPGYGRFYTWTDVTDTRPEPDFSPGGGGDSHDTVLLEWLARTPSAGRYDGGPPRVLFRVQQPFGNHNGGLIAFNPLARPGTPEYGMLYVGVADGGSAGDPLDNAQNPASIFGKVLRIDPLGSNSANGHYGIPADNPFVSAGRNRLGEVWALGVRNPQRFGWDSKNGAMYLADIGQNIIEELSPVTRGANLGWNVWEASFRYRGRGGADISARRADPAMTFPIAEYDHTDPLLTGRSAVTGVVVYRGSAIPQLAGTILFGDNPSGEIFHVSADEVPSGGQDPIARVLLNEHGEAVTLLHLIRAKNTAQGRSPASRADLRFGTDTQGHVYLLNKQDGVIRLLVPPAPS